MPFFVGHSLMQPSRSLAPLTLAALGIVYGDIGTSPLYTLKESFAASALPVNEANIFGFVSLIIWALLLVVTLKYVLFILHASLEGEGGVVVLMQKAIHQMSGKPAAILLFIGLMGTALFFGDAIITPAISVLSAVEGLVVLSPALEKLVLPLALGVLLALFALQRKGTHRIGSWFGPVMLIWFSVLALAGIYQILQHPRILLAINPYYGLNFVLHHGFAGFASLGAVVLAVTGAEALYADMGHFGRKPIQYAWLSLVLPALALSYIGQGALLLHQPQAISNPFFYSVPSWGLLPLIILATAATIIASQAVISGAFSLTQQAILLDFIPRMSIRHTNSHEIGQIYMPAVNWLLLVAVLLVVLGFRNSSNLAAAYGITATGTMVLTTCLFAVVMRKQWGWPLFLVGGLIALFLCFDLAFLSSNLLKIPSGGWFPLTIALLLVFIFTTWRKGRQKLQNELHKHSLPLSALLSELASQSPQIVAGNAVFLISQPHTTPRALQQNLEHNKVLHAHNLLIHIRIADTPRIAHADRLHIEVLNTRFTHIIATYGFREPPNIHHILALCAKQGIHLDMENTSFFLSRDSINIARRSTSISRLRARLFRLLYRNSTNATSFYRLPGNRVIEIGALVEL